MPDKREQLIDIMQDAAKGETKEMLRRQIAALKAENERLKKALSEQIDRDISGIFPGERALAERAGGVKVDDLAQEIRRVDGSHTLGAGALAEALMPFLTTEPAAPEGRQEAAAWRYRWRDGGDWKLSFHFDDGLDPAKYEQEPLFARPAEQAVTDRKFALGDRVTKIKGSSWTGRVVGFYCTALTPIGYAVESDTEVGSVQIYPEAALKAAMEAGRHE